MVKDNTGNSVNLDLGLLSVSVDELLEILRSKGISRIRAESEAYEFDSLDDMSANPGLLCGYPIITCDKVRIEMGKFTRGVRSYGDREGTVLARSIHADLMQRRGLLERYSEFWLFRYYILFPLIIISIMINSFAKEFLVSIGVDKIYDGITGIYFPFAIIKSAIDIYCRFKRPAVRYEPKESFMSRHAESIVVGTITAVLGALALPVLSRLANLVGLG
jgi:hypothetical protein